jgi:hypothetical protein
MSYNEVTSRRAGTAASHVLRDPKASPQAKTAAGSAETQRPDHVMSEIEQLLDRLVAAKLGVSPPYSRSQLVVALRLAVFAAEEAAAPKPNPLVALAELPRPNSLGLLNGLAGLGRVRTADTIAGGSRAGTILEETREARTILEDAYPAPVSLYNKLGWR